MTTGLHVRMLGPLTVRRGDAGLQLPSSRKVRALFGYLAFAPHGVGRSRLCDLLWDVPNDPRGELRWCLSKLRGLLDETGRHRVRTEGDIITLDLDDCFLDAREIASAAEKGFDPLETSRLGELAALFAGDFLEGLEISRSTEFESWMLVQRERFRVCHTAVLQQLAGRLPPEGDEVLVHASKWVELAPLDQEAHVILLGALAARGRLTEGEKHLAAMAKLHGAQGLDMAALHAAWQAAKVKRPSLSVTIKPVLAPVASMPTSSDGNSVFASRRASLAVMPFVEQADEAGVRAGLADGLTHDIITRLAKLRSLFIIARGSVFALAEQRISPDEAGRRLNVDYVASGTLRHRVGQVVVTVELIEARTARIVWADTFDQRLSDTFLLLDEIGDRIVSSIVNEIEAVEKNRAILKPPDSLDAWEAYHRGLWHMYRFTKSDNELARHCFRRSVGLDPTFARAHAGLSFTHWQNAFQHWGDREEETDRAFEAAGRSLMADDHDPAAHWAMGRALWLRRKLDDSVSELARAVDLSPNFALGHYALAFVLSQSGDPIAAIGSADHSRHLSPFDPLLFGILGARAMAHVRLGQFDEAAEWAVKAAARPNAHVIIRAIAAHCLALAGRIDEGRAFVASIRETLPHYSVEEFLATFRFTEDAAGLFRHGAQRIGLK